MQRLAGRIILLWGWRRALTAFLAGAFAVLAHAPYDFVAAGFVSFPILVWLLDGVTAADARGPLRRLTPSFAIGWWFGFGYFAAGLWWIGGALLVEAESFAWALPLAVLGVPFLLAFFYGFAAALARLGWSDGIGRIAALAFAFGLAEWLRGILFTGFPWLAIGYAVMPVPEMMQSVAHLGMNGMNALAVFLFALPALLGSTRHRRVGLALGVLLAAGHLGYGAYRLGTPPPPSQRSLALRVVQPDIDLSEKWDAKVRDRIFETTMGLTREPPNPGTPQPELILWPETSVPFLFTERPDALASLGEALGDGQMLLAGAVREEGAGRYYNSIVSIDGRGEMVDAVDKLHLVPFGEYIPFADLLGRFGLDSFVAGPMTFEAGSERHALRLPGGLKALPFICYEVIFPELVGEGAGDADLLINVTNDAWFGDTPGPYQHFRQAQLRAVETGLPVVRAANTGISGVIDPYGRVVDALAMNVRGVVDVSLGIPNAGLSGAPRLVGFGILAALALIAAALRVQAGRR